MLWEKHPACLCTFLKLLRLRSCCFTCLEVKVDIIAVGSLYRQRSGIGTFRMQFIQLHRLPCSWTLWIAYWAISLHTHRIFFLIRLPSENSPTHRVSLFSVNTNGQIGCSHFFFSSLGTPKLINCSPAYLQSTSGKGFILVRNNHAEGCLFQPDPLGFGIRDGWTHLEALVSAKSKCKRLSLVLPSSFRKWYPPWWLHYVPQNSSIAKSGLAKLIVNALSSISL